jgi:predicted DsbA family dithiol-disulfide isomerase
MATEPALRIAVWSDYVCPFCYLELPELERLREAYDGKIALDWRAYELRPEPAPTLDPDGEYLHRVWTQSVYPMAEERGMTLRLPPVQPRSRKAFEAAEYARTIGQFDAMHRALFRAFFEEGRDIGEVAVLRDIGRGVGLDEAALAEALQSGRFTAKVIEDQDLARRFGLRGVPASLMMVVKPDDRPPLLVSGAQPYEELTRAVEQALGTKPGPQDIAAQ